LVFVFAMIAVLLIPGPTNALLASSTHQQGVLKTLPFIPMEWLGYVYGIGLWALFIHLFHPIWPALTLILHIASVAYVLWLAFHLWKSSHLQKHDQHHPHIRTPQLFISALRNLKPCCWRQDFPSETWDSVGIRFWCLQCSVWC
jgi:threonine/homoserine/homoserine lactone efflux protein